MRNTLFVLSVLTATFLIQLPANACETTGSNESDSTNYCQTRAVMFDSLKQLVTSDRSDQREALADKIKLGCRTVAKGQATSFEKIEAGFEESLHQSICKCVGSGARSLASGDLDCSREIVSRENMIAAVKSFAKLGEDEECASRGRNQVRCVNSKRTFEVDKDRFQPEGSSEWNYRVKEVSELY